MKHYFYILTGTWYLLYKFVPVFGRLGNNLVLLSTVEPSMFGYLQQLSYNKEIHWGYPNYHASV